MLRAPVPLKHAGMNAILYRNIGQFLLEDAMEAASGEVFKRDDRPTVEALLSDEAYDDLVGEPVLASKAIGMKADYLPALQVTVSEPSIFPLVRSVAVHGLSEHVR